MTPEEEAAVLEDAEAGEPVNRSETGPGKQEPRLRKVRLLDLAELATLPLPVWRIYGLVAGITLLWGGPGSYKTFLAISWAVAIASGRSWCGRKVKQGTVVFIVGEGALRSFYNRVTASALAQGIAPDQVAKLPIYATEGPVDLSRWDRLQAQELLAAAKGVADSVGPVGVMFVDTVSRCLPGEENNQEAMQGFVGALDAARATLGCDVVPIHHSNAEGERERGSSVLPGAVDGNLRITAGEPDEQGRVPLSLYTVKLKEADSGPGRDPVVRLLAVQAVVEDAAGFPLRDEAGLPLTTRYLVLADPEDSKAEDSMDAALLDAIPEAGIAAGPLADRLKRRKKTVLSDLHRLRRAGLVVLVGKGRSTRWGIGSRFPEPIGTDGTADLIGSPGSGVFRPGPGTDSGNRSGNGGLDCHSTTSVPWNPRTCEVEP